MSELMVFVESNTTGTGILAFARARALGLQPVLLTNLPSRYRGLAEAAPTVIECDTNSSADLLDAVRRLDGRVAGVTTTSEFYLTAVAATAAALGLPGNPPQAARTCRDKAALRAALHLAGVPQPRFAVARDTAEAADAVARIGLPCVVKPVDDTGSNAVRVCRGRTEAVRHAEEIVAVATNVRGQPTARTALVEEYIGGAEFSVEMFSRDGAATCVGITEKFVTAGPHPVEWRHVYPAEDPAGLAALVTRALRATGIRTGPTHTEVRVAGGRPAVIEINARLAGGMIPELIRFVDGLDLLAEQIRAATGAPPHLDRARTGHAGIQFLTALTDGVLRGFEGAAAARTMPGVQAVAVDIDTGAPVRPPRSSYDRLGSIICTGPTRADVIERLGRAVDTLRIHLAGAPGRAGAGAAR